jgi:hypothetical protein
MKLLKLSLLLFPICITTFGLSACGSIESAAQNDCTSIGWQMGSSGYNECYKARIYERELDYSKPPGDQPRPSLL